MAPYPVPFSFQELIDGFIVHFDIAVHVLPGDRDDRASLLALEIGQAVHKTVTDFMASTGGPPINIFLRDGAQLYPFTVRKSHNLQETLRTFAAMVGTFDRPLRVTTCGDYVIDPNLTVEQVCCLRAR